MTILIYGFDFSIIKKIVLYTCRGDEILQLHWLSPLCQAAVKKVYLVSLVCRFVVYKTQKTLLLQVVSI